MLAVLLLAALIASLTMTYARSSIVAGEAAPGQKNTVAVQTVVDSGLAWARQSLITGGSRTTSLVTPTGATLTASVADEGAAVRGIDLAATSGSRSGGVHALAEVHFAPGSSLPTLSDAARAALSAPGAVVRVSVDTTYENQIVNGVLRVSKGKRLELRNVVLRGAIVSENAFSDAAWSDGDRTEIRIDESVIIESGTTLWGCAIVAPDAELDLSSNARFQCQGVIVARLLDSDPAAVARLHDQLAVGATQDSLAGIVQLGVGRGPRAWPTALKSGSQGITRVVFDRAGATSSERSAIQGFDISAWRAAGVTAR